MLSKLSAQERKEIQDALVSISNNANVMADRLDPNRQCKIKDGKRYEMARHFDAIYNLAKAALLKMNLK